MFKRICKITFVTHGATIHSAEGIINDSLKYPKINEDGEEEIAKVCEYLKNRGVAYDRIYSSPATYCTESAHIIAKMYHKKIVPIDMPNRNHGNWQGQTYADICNEGGIQNLTKTPKNGETIKHFNTRINKQINALIQENKGNRIIVVTTPEIVQSILATTLELAPESQFKMLIKTGSLTQISYFEGWSSVIYSDYKPL